uniref:Astaxanthin binding fasciclin family protein n=1 Tax=Coelastrella astaxanthina TaxID=2833457 RepID=UPI00240E9B2B|nr:Chain A, Astaxanthin binding fasciclin family protein [Coelastrella astaxanthina]
GPHMATPKANATTAKPASTTSTPVYATLSNAVTAGAAAPQLTTLFAAVRAANVTGALTANTTWTILAPTNDAFAKRLAKLNLTADAVLKNKDLLVKILSYHVIPSGAVYSKALKDNATVATALKDASVTVRLYQGKVMFKGPVNKAQVTVADIKAGGSVIHVINDVLLPPGVVSDAVAKQWKAEWEAMKAEKKVAPKATTGRRFLLF